MLELNASSGTPMMKSSWSILQAAGYAPRSHVWQVRNPQQMQPGQSRVFQIDVSTLKQEFDIKVIQRQVQDYNYSGALITLQESGLRTDPIQALLEAGYYRLALDFDRAFSSLKTATQAVDLPWLQELARLRQKDAQALLQEAYFNTLIRLQTRKYADFLVGLFKLQEQVLYFLVRERIGLAVSGQPSQKAQSWQAIQQADQGKLYQFLQTYTLPRGDRLDMNRISRFVLQAIVEYYPQFTAIAPLIRDLNQYCELRNESVHGFVGVSEIDDEATLLNTLRKLMKHITRISNVNPFDQLNGTIVDLLNRIQLGIE